MSRFCSKPCYRRTLRMKELEGERPEKKAKPVHRPKGKKVRARAEKQVAEVKRTHYSLDSLSW